MTIHSEGITDADLDRFEKVAEPIYRSTVTAGEASRFQMSDLGMWIIRLVAEVRRLRVSHAPTDDEREALATILGEPVRGTLALADRILAAGFRRSEVPGPRGDVATIVLPEVDWDRYPHMDTEEKRRAYLYAIASMESGGMISPIPPKLQGEPSEARVDMAARASFEVRDARAALRAARLPTPRGKVEPSEAKVMIAAKAIRIDLERQNEERHDGPYTAYRDGDEGCMVDGVVNLVEAARAALRAAGGAR